MKSIGQSRDYIQTGLSDSLAGRFEKLVATHWTFSECREAFNISLDDYIGLGGYPGAYAFANDPDRWMAFVQDALIEPVIGKDILMQNSVRKPPVFRRLFSLTCVYGGQIVSYQKLLGELQDAGNVTTLAHYQELLDNAMLIRGLQKYSGSTLRQRSSAPKWNPLNTALMTASIGLSPSSNMTGSPLWGHLVETAVGAHLINQSFGKTVEVYYWRDGNDEVDFVVAYQKKLLAIEVKSGPDQGTHRGLTAFKQKFPHASLLKVGGDGLDLETFFTSQIEHYF